MRRGNHNRNYRISEVILGLLASHKFHTLRLEGSCSVLVLEQILVPMSWVDACASLLLLEPAPSSVSCCAFQMRPDLRSSLSPHYQSTVALLSCLVRSLAW
jgi:hypothetical protein